MTTTKRPFGRSLVDLGTLTSAETTLKEACRLGTVARVSPARPGQKTETNVVRASVLRFLALGGDDEAPVHEHGVQLHGAWIEGALELAAARISTPLAIEHSTFENAVGLHAAHFTGWVRFSGSRVAEIDARSVRTNGDMDFNGGFEATGRVQLDGAKIVGDLSCDGGMFDGRDDKALSLDRAVIEGGTYFNGGFKAAGKVSLLGAQIGGELNCSGATFDGKAGTALSLDRAVIKGSVFFDDGFKATGEVRLLGAQIGSNLDCSSGTFDAHDKDALSLDRVVIRGGVFFTDGFAASGRVRMGGANIGSDLNCCKGTFEGTDGEALSLDNTVVSGGIFFSDGFKATGTVRLVDARIGGSLHCSSATFKGKNGPALALDRAVVNGSVFFTDGFTAMGEVRLSGANIGGQLGCVNATFDGRLHLQLAHIGAVLILTRLKKPATVDLSSARVEQLSDDCNSWGPQTVLDGFEYRALVGGAPTDAASRLRWLDLQSSTHCGLDAVNPGFRPQPWRQLQKVLLEMGHAEDARQVAIAFEDRLFKADLIGLSPATWPSWLRAVDRWICRLLHRAFGALTGYGYRPLTLVLWVSVVWIACAAWYWIAASQYAVFAPTNPSVFHNSAYLECRPDREAARVGLAPFVSAPDRAGPARDAARIETAPPIDTAYSAPTIQPDLESPGGNWYLCNSLREEYSAFSPLAYSLDVLLPVVDLHQEKEWWPLVPTPKANPVAEFFTFGWKHTTRLVIWMETLIGWVASLLLVAIVSGLTKRRDA